MKLIIASNNAHKLVEIRAILGDAFDEILSMREAGIDHETVEDGQTFLENAEKKAREIMEISGCCALADDSGLCVDALGGAPGIYSARFSGVHGDDKANNRKLLRELEGVPDRDRGAHFACAMVLVRPDGSAICRSGAAPMPSCCRRRRTPSATGPLPCTRWWPSWNKTRRKKRGSLKNNS